MIIEVNFPNLSNWKEEAWKISGLQRDSNHWPLRYRCDPLPTELWSHTLGARSIYWVHISQLLKLENLLRWSLFTFMYNRIANMNYFIFNSHHFTPHGRYELNKLTSLPTCGFIAQLVEHRTGIAEVTGSNPVEALIFFRLLLSNCLNWKIYCDDHSSLSCTIAMLICIISYIIYNNNINNNPFI